MLGSKIGSRCQQYNVTGFNHILLAIEPHKNRRIIHIDAGRLSVFVELTSQVEFSNPREYPRTRRPSLPAQCLRPLSMPEQPHPFRDLRSHESHFQQITATRRAIRHAKQMEQPWPELLQQKGAKKRSAIRIRRGLAGHSHRLIRWKDLQVGREVLPPAIGVFSPVQSDQKRPNVKAIRNFTGLIARQLFVAKRFKNGVQASSCAGRIETEEYPNAHRDAERQRKTEWNRIGVMFRNILYCRVHFQLTAAKDEHDHSPLDPIEPNRRHQPHDDSNDSATAGQHNGFGQKLYCNVRCFAPRARRIPISRVRSVTVASIMFIMPITAHQKTDGGNRTQHHIKIVRIWRACRAVRVERRWNSLYRFCGSASDFRESLLPSAPPVPDREPSV